MENQSGCIMMTEEEIRECCKELVDAPRQRVEDILKDVKTILSVFCDDNAKLIRDDKDIQRTTLKAQVSIERINDYEYKQKHTQEWYGFIDDLSVALTKLCRK